MKNSKINTAIAALTVSAALVSAPVYAATDAAAKEAMDKRIAEGKELAFSRSQGNCLACHNIMNAMGQPQGTSPGTIGPALVMPAIRFGTKQNLYDKLWAPEGTFKDAPRAGEQIRVKYSMMPYFGAYGILSDDEISKIVDYLWSLNP
ncbi:sulfur oxidation c-type cytochrome SoxX [Thiomicrospira microaerophila]|uniref:sulfur oxidation c-type cytochrome SoxX n=1 Tax=Thiomicrospira microaerophila TaxID=406020 RepID=UPI0005C84A4B|nr:sulfur oxidation c-type cytochrome SoxX [Thiomicrospira microaerophila]